MESFVKISFDSTVLPKMVDWFCFNTNAKLHFLDESRVPKASIVRQEKPMNPKQVADPCGILYRFYALLFSNSILRGRGDGALFAHKEISFGTILAHSNFQHFRYNFWRYSPRRCLGVLKLKFFRSDTMLPVSFWLLYVRKIFERIL